jgi:pimeloyl-ACP methyl ester carboxylesterase
MTGTCINQHLNIISPDKISIPATLCEASSKDSDWIIMLHGITTHKDEFGNFFGLLADHFKTAGFSSLRFDFRGHGDSQVSSRDFSITSQVLDCMSVIQWIQNKFNKARIHLVACSFGSPAAIFTALQPSCYVTTISMVCPVLDYKRTFLKPESEWAQEVFNQEALSEAFITGNLHITPGFQIDIKLLLEMSIVNPVAALTTLEQKILLIHGDEDSMVPFQISEEVARQNPAINFIPYHDMEHGFTVPTDEDGTDPESLRNIETMAAKIVKHIRS